MRDRREYMERRYEKNKEYILKQHKEYQKKNREYISEHYKEYWKEYYCGQNRERKLRHMSEWLKTEDGKACNQRHHIKRQADEKGVINTLTAQEWQNILRGHGFKCIYCGKVLSDLFNKPTRDHIIPISRGGNNTKENVVPACLNCNDKKGTKILNYKEVNFWKNSIGKEVHHARDNKLL